MGAWGSLQFAPVLNKVDCKGVRIFMGVHKGLPNVNRLIDR